jgi:hypothetical protein
MTEILKFVLTKCHSGQKGFICLSFGCHSRCLDFVDKLQREKAKIMSVERRYSKRYPMDGDVYIRYRKQRVFPAKALNCSMQGIYLKTESLTLLTGALVELEMFRAGRLYEVMGIVTHAQSDGIGVMLWKPQPALYESVLAGTPRHTTMLQNLQADSIDHHL